MRNVSKSIFLNALTCPTLGWLMRWERFPQTPTLGEMFRMEQGIEIGRRARELYPEGILMDDPDVASASKKTKRLMEEPEVSILFEGTFLMDGFAAKADILKRKDNGGWHVIEVKSSVSDREEFIDDMAYTAMVMDRSGIKISDVSLFLISRDFRLGMKNETLLVEVGHTDEVLDRVEGFKSLWQPIEETTRGSVKPAPELRFECRKCELLKACQGKDIENHVFDLPRLSPSKFDQLVAQGIVCIEDIPERFPLTGNQAKVRNCVKTKKPFVGDKLEGALSSISWPAYYLDFETVLTAIPLYPDVAPHTQIPTQYSIHKCSEPGHIMDHFEYLADPGKDCRRTLAEHLIGDLGGEGSIIVYSHFEKTTVNRLGRLYPDLLGALQGLIDRMVDLEAIIRKHFYHPDFHGSTSIKRTLPALVPNMSYDELEIANGDTALTVFALLALGKYEDREAEAIKRNLLVYCRQDTLAMVKLHERLGEYV